MLPVSASTSPRQSSPPAPGSRSTQSISARDPFKEASPTLTRVASKSHSIPQELPTAAVTPTSLSADSVVTSVAESGNNKLSSSGKWLSRNESFNASDAPPEISLSKSSSVASELQDIPGQGSTESIFTMLQALENAENGSDARNLSPGSPSGRGSKDNEEVMEEWATPELEEGGGLGDNSPTVVRTAAAELEAPAPKKGLFGLRRSRSNLRMFANKGDSPASDPDGGKRRGSDSSSLFDIRPTPTTSSSNSSFQHPPPQGSATYPSSSSQPNGLSQSISSAQNPNVAGRIGGWFSSILQTSASSTHLPLSRDPSASDTLSYSLHSSPRVHPSVSPSSITQIKNSNSAKKSSTSALNIGARLGPLDRMLDKAVQYFLDTDSTADKCEEDIWVLGVRHAGYTPPSIAEQKGDGSDRRSITAVDEKKKKGKGLNFGAIRKGKERRTNSIDSVRGIEAERRFSTASQAPSSPSRHTPSPSISPVTSPTLSPRTSFQLPPQPMTHGWPLLFYQDFYSRIALTYRVGFPPIPCSPNSAGGVHAVMNTLSLSMGRGGGRTNEGLSSDTGWGCMLRTGQSLLANALITVHLGRDWRRSLPPPPVVNGISTESSAAGPSPSSPSHAEYARILSLFIDDPSPLAPFSVHRFALMGKQLGKEVGEWFGPSTAAGAIKALVNDYPPVGMAVCSVLDGTVYQSDVAHLATEGSGNKWKKPVLVLIGVRLGIDGVNPIYHEGIKAIFRFPQSVGIAGGRPSSSYYFVGSQANSLFYIDPHHPKPSIALKHPPPALFSASQSIPLSRSLSTTTLSESSNNVLSNDSFVTVSSPPLKGDKSVELGNFFAEAYSDAALRSYHTEKVRKMGVTSLDPSMLLGFLIRDESDWEDFATRVQELHADHTPIFTVADQPPSWMRRSAGPTSSNPNADEHDSESGVESFSEPEDWESESTGLASSTRAHQSGEGEEEWEEAVSGARGESENGLAESILVERETLPPLPEKDFMPGRGPERSEDSTITMRDRQSWHSATGAAFEFVEEPSEASIIVLDAGPSVSSEARHEEASPHAPSTLAKSHSSTSLQSPTPPSPTTKPTTTADTLKPVPSLPRIGGAALLAPGSSSTPVEFDDKREEGWEGVGLEDVALADKEDADRDRSKAKSEIEAVNVESEGVLLSSKGKKAEVSI